MKRAGKRDRIFRIALGVSFAFHLSMVTIFRIVIYFPADELGYYRISIIDSAEAPAFSKAFQPDVEAAEKPALLGEEAESEAIQPSWPNLPSVDLPRLNFSELKLPSTAELDTDARMRYEELLDDTPDDLWAQVGEKLHTVGEIFSRKDDPIEASSDTDPQRMMIGHPAPGFEAVLEWLTPPYTRQPLLVEKVDALWGADAAALNTMSNESLVLVFEVNPEGNVLSVQMPLADEAGIVKDSVDALKRYQFTPLLEGPEKQHGTLTIQAAKNEAGGIL